MLLASSTSADPRSLPSWLARPNGARALKGPIRCTHPAVHNALLVPPHDAGATAAARAVLAPLAFDIGFNNGDDTALLLKQGYRVVAVEASPLLLAAGRQRFAAPLADGRLTLLGVALAPSDTAVGSTLSFYTNRHNSEWSSFRKAQGCRRSKAERPAKVHVSADNCHVVEVEAVACASLFRTHGAPLLMKLDASASDVLSLKGRSLERLLPGSVNGDETACIDALEALSYRPGHVVIELSKASPRHLATLRRFGYTSFKFVPQGPVHRSQGNPLPWGATSGPMGEFSRDCRHGWNWRNLSSMLRQIDALERAAPVLPPAGNAAAPVVDPCTGHGGWVDVHARHCSLSETPHKEPAL